MGLNFIKKLFGNAKAVSESKDITEELKTILRSKWEEQKKATDVPFDELYCQMVEEAIMTIKATWKKRAERSNNFKCPVDELEIEAYEAFFITEDLKLYSDSLYRPINPQTGCDCFYSHFTFPNSEMVEQYVADIMAFLPEGTFVENTATTRHAFGDVMVYSFTIKLNDLLEE